MTAIKRLIPNLFTAGNLVGGILAIIFTLTGRIEIAPYFIFASAIMDFLDGFMARLLKVPSEIGKQLDSLADMVTFGVAPGIIVYELLRNYFVMGYYGPDWGLDNFKFPIADINIEQAWANSDVAGSAYFQYIPYVAFIIPVFALFRLAKFNLDTRQSDSFIGLPTPAMTLFFAVIPILVTNAYNGVLIGEISVYSLQFQLTTIVMTSWFLVISAIVMSILMVSEIPLFALKFKHFKFKGNEIRYLFLTVSILMLATLFFWALPLIIILYVILSLINNGIAKNTKNEI
ncbi:CDP-alcohol phosphatidyltransferase family protein [Crocinitomix sp.]|nr:CDP-alcohol phosphatidyltransferase family protein [Crocinitomix sp.]